MPLTSSNDTSVNVSLSDYLNPEGHLTRLLLALLATAGLFYVNIMPAIVEGLIIGLDLSKKQAGIISSANVYGAAFGAFAAIYIVKKELDLLIKII